MTTTVATPTPHPAATGRPGALARFALGVALAWAAAAGATALLLQLAAPDSPRWWRGLTGAAVVTALAALVSLGPIAWGLRGSVYRLTAASFMAAGLRGLVSVCGAVIATRVGGYPHTPTLLLVVPFYFVILAVEVALTARTLWTADPAEAAAAGGAADARAPRHGT